MQVRLGLECWAKNNRVREKEEPNLGIRAGALLVGVVKKVSKNSSS